MSFLRVAFVGSGAVNFGGTEGPWDHSARLERLGGVEVVAIVDPLVAKARAVLERKLAGPHCDLYRDCVVLASCSEVFAMKEERRPQAAFIGVPPFVHGSLDEGLDLELPLIRAGIHLFVEKPVSVQPPEKFRAYVAAVMSEQKKHNVVVGVGYMFRYHPAVDKIKEVLSSHQKTLLSVNARYNCAYSELDRPFWWDTRKSGGPIVEQATHFCDLIRYLAGDVCLDTIKGIAVPAAASEGDVGALTHVPSVVKESELPVEARVPRVTLAHWRFKEGGIGSLNHGLTLWGKKYESSIDLWADGLRISLEEPYEPDCMLRVRRGYTDKEEVFTFPDADPYLEEDRAFLEAVRTGDQNLIRSSYEDASKTYELSWGIRRASMSA